jgi:peptidylprolyl isomerase
VSDVRDLRTGRARCGAVLATLAAASLIAACGSSGSSSTIGVGVENKADESLAKASESAAPSTPTSGPLSKEPKVTPPKGPAPSKTVTKDIIMGTGAEAKVTNPIVVNYVGALSSNGTVFDASWKREEPFSFTLGTKATIPGWEKGIPGMRVGGRRELIVPPAEAYGAKGSPPRIPPNETLVFVIDLLGT